MQKRILTVTAMVLLASSAWGQHAANAKSFTLKGQVTEVGKNRLTVNHGNVEGFMAAMTMPYKVEKPDVLSQVKAGDQIEATVYENDYTLYNIKVVSAAKGKAKDAKK